jgi:FtsZ-interacting cell division protein ZipA
LAEFRWILLGFGLLLMGGIWWWGSRRSAQAPGRAELRESSALKEPHLDESPKMSDTPMVPAPRERSAKPLEPLQIHTADFDDIPIMDEPIMVEIGPLELPPAEPSLKAPAHITQPVEVTAPPAEKPVRSKPAESPVARVTPGVVPTIMPENSDRIAAATTPQPNTSERQKIVTVRVCAPGNAQWSGAALLGAFEAHGLAYGRYQVFHRRHVDGRSLFCVASLKEPGTFDVAQMPAQEFRGVTLFAVLPGPLEPLLTVDELLAAARDLAASLTGMIQDAKGMPMSPQRAAALRDEVARFQASLVN